MIESPLLKHIAGYIGGEWVAADSGKSFKVTNPADGAHLADVPNMGPPETERAIAAAKAALARATPELSQRKKWLEQIADALVEEKEEIGRILCLEHGKPWKEAQGEAVYAAGFFRNCANQLEVLEAETLKERPRGCSWTVHHRPAGVVALITPWNFPIGMIAKKLSAAIAAGCPSITKPASQTPLTMIALFELLDSRLDMPPGYVNLIMGSARPIGDTLCEHPDVALLSFTGSTEVGRELIKKTADQVKRLALELGGNAPFIVFEDADLDKAADNLIANKFRGAGQTCVCANRVYVQESVAEKFTAKVVERVNKLKVGDGMKEDTDLGPLIDRNGFEKVRRHVKNALELGAKLEAGKPPEELDPDKGTFYPPTVITGVTHDMEACREETFGPLVPILTFRDEAQAIEDGNRTQFGLAAYVFTKDEARAARVIPRLSFGHVGWNTGTGPTPEAPFGGVKQSGYGREGGSEGLLEFAEVQTVPRGD